MTTPQGPQSDQPPSGAADPDHATTVFAAPGRVPPSPPSQGPPAQGEPHQGAPQDRSMPGPPPQDRPFDGSAAQDRAFQGPPQERPYAGPASQDRVFQGPPPQDRPLQGPPPQGGPYRDAPPSGPPSGAMPQVPSPVSASSGPPPQSQPTRQREQSQGLPAQGPPPHGGSHHGPPPPGRPPEGADQWTSGPPSRGQFGAPSHVGAPRPQSANAIWVLGLVSLLAVVCGLSISEDGENAWHTVHAWGALAILGSLLTLATVAAGGSLRPARAWQVAACGAGALVLFWVLFILPAVGSNTSLVTTIGVAAGAVAVWIAPGRDAASRPDPGQGPEHSW